MFVVVDTLNETVFGPFDSEEEAKEWTAADSPPGFQGAPPMEGVIPHFITEVINVEWASDQPDRLAEEADEARFERP